MSGIVGVFNLNGILVREDQLRNLANSLSRSAPDEQNVWLARNVGLGHGLLKTSASTIRQQPCSLNDRLWITCDARLDNRNDLVRSLVTQPFLQGDDITALNSDAELILFAYRAWGEDCVSHFIGDFAFAIWDSDSQQLFCARDHLGVRQFYYAHSRDTFVFSNSLSTLRLHPSVSNKLNEIAIGDFLLFGLNQDRTSTTFADIERLPPAHSLTITATDLRLREYWTPSVGTLNYKSTSDYVENFRELLNKAVSDRLDTPSVGICMSGGLDSSAIAALTSRTRKLDSHQLELRAYCVVYDRVFPDEERKYATMTADALGMEIEFLEGDSINQKDSIRTRGHAPEPFNVDPIYVVADELLEHISIRSRVAFTGWDGDAFMNETPRHLFAWLLRRARLGTLAANVARYVKFEHQLPPVGLRTAWRNWRDPNWNAYPFPRWINKEFSRKLGLEDRWHSINSASKDTHPIRPHAFSTMFSPSWDALFNRFDPAVTQLPLEVRHPLIDIRVLEYLLALPVIPWLSEKRILRQAMLGYLPDQVRSRKKSILTGDPGVQLRYSKKLKQIDQFQAEDTLRTFIDRNLIPLVSEETDGNQLWLNVRPFSLNQWLVKSYPPMEILDD